VLSVLYNEFSVCFGVHVGMDGASGMPARTMAPLGFRVILSDRLGECGSGRYLSLVGVLYSGFT
jgi:hypothetical protein